MKDKDDKNTNGGYEDLPDPPPERKLTWKGWLILAVVVVIGYVAATQYTGELDTERLKIYGFKESVLERKQN
ncbi:hypothetical protein C4K38_2188 [Pseudomonas chlororaphis subsp. piscium]|uniref:hypothetical protein n=1 Tax=Pseudomonas chlororaphis TaxID=587753 RepID=UPI0006A5EFF1|nr:hypothetical protein [Pseudomonas chlororaphis]AZC30148.1 hypothetical protein C4K38_2188 [Pseudomonas chlororaphis subsp. piscium]WDG94078.1 hypothetical protein PUP49_11845 [Pseudomonas chlororaphis]SDT23894.1 hypothetical protein SAMN05216585_5187 [Pseudomonas chlororaphis]